MTIIDPAQQQQVVDPPEPTGIPVPKEGETKPTEGSGPAAAPTAPETKPSGKTFTQEDIERIRKEEKDKLYKSIEDLKGQLSTLTSEQEARQKALKEAEKQAADAAKAKAEEEMSAKQLLEQKEQEWNQRFAQIEQDRERSSALLEQERKFSALQDYRATRLQAEAENIMPELRDYINGASEAEIEQSIALAIEKTNKVISNFQQATQQQRQQQRGASVTSPPVGPLEDNSQNYETLSADDIRGMDMNEYAKRRGSLLGAASKNRNKGLFG